MKALITGGAGFIGSHIAARLRGIAEVRVLDNLRTGYRRNLDGLPVEFVEGSILDRAAVRAAMEGVDWVFHLAAMVSVPESVQRPAECRDLNVTGLLNVLEAASAAGARKLCFSSSAAIYGDNPVVPKTEAMTPEPKSPYAETKLEGERLCAWFTHTRRLETVCFRFFNVFGPRQDPKSAYAAAVPIFIQQALANEPITIFGDGGQTRDFVYVQDVAAANVHAATTAGLTGVFNVGYGGQMTILELARQIIAATGSHSPIVHAPVRAGDVRHSRADVSALTAAGFRPVSSLERGLAETLAWRR
jgi:UDP-glucose 4-epimerase